MLRQFVRKVSVSILQDYLQVQDVFLKPESNSTVQQLIPAIEQSIEKLSAEQQSKLHRDVSRMMHMADDIGQSAIFSVLEEDHLPELPSAEDVSAWCYTHNPDKFRQAEEVRYADHYRHGNYWRGYRVAPHHELITSASAIDDFKRRLQDNPALGQRVKVMWFHRNSRDEQGESQELIQLMIYQEELPDNYLAFDEQERVVLKTRKPVHEYVLLYCQASGVIEVIASKQSRRDALVKAFTATLIETSLTEPLSLWQFDLSSLLTSSQLSYDAADGIESVRVSMLKFRQHEQALDLQLNLSSKNQSPLHQYTARYLTQAVPVDFTPIQAKLTVRFKEAIKRKKVVNITISSPNYCDLRFRTPRELLIGEKYLKRWGLLKKIAS